ncbi:MAG: VCBS repeat-containing protein, partial [Oscillospiraceae bacterium]|nr:VCBS repeat-containing protein [Oscillospiraceae bacterium]
NCFYSFFDRSFIGAESFVKLDACPVDITLPEVGGDLDEMRGIIADFAGLYKDYVDFGRLSSYDYGVGVKCSTATALVSCDDADLYTVNSYGDGFVFFTNPLLPNEYSINGFSLTSRSDEQRTMVSTTISANQILENAFAAYVAKQNYGFALYRIFGSFTRPNAAWELHYEDISGIANGSSDIFNAMCRDYLQIPSYTLIRNSYNWNRRSEAVTYFLGSGGKYEPAVYDGVYSSGAHIDAGGEFLSLDYIEHAGSYFDDYPEYDKRACADVGDLNGDGVPDIVTGSSDGGVYLYTGIGYDGRFRTEAAVKLVQLGGYTAPCICDCNGDGVQDIIVGCEGTLYYLMGEEDGTFNMTDEPITTPISGQVLPEIADIDGNGAEDIILGSAEGRMLVWYDTYQITGNGTDISDKLGDTGSTWLSPRVSEGRLYIGTYDGYTAVYDARTLEHEGWLDSAEINYKGNLHIKTGNYSTPAFADLNGDGTLDFISSCLEYGVNYPIDDELFPCADSLQREIDNMLGAGIYVGMHLLTGRYTSAKREEQEVQLHLAALEKYGIDTSFIGSNQHTWHTSSLTPTQTFESLWNGGVKWSSGFEAPGSTASPEGCAECVIALPFYLEKNGEKTILLQGNSMFRNDGWNDILAKYAMPACMYAHCDFVYESTDEMIWFLDTAEEFRNKNDYDFVTEEQLMLATAAAMNTDVSVSGSAGENLSLTLTPYIMSTDGSIRDEAYESSVGVRIEFSEKYDAGTIATDSAVWYRDGNSLSISLEDGVRIFTGESESGHVSRVE